MKELEKGLRGQIKKSKKVIAIGETGIDSPSPKATEEQSISNWQNSRSLSQQLELFEMQAKLAVEFNLPLIIHNRNGNEQVLAMVEKYFNQGSPSSRQGGTSAYQGVCHCFVQDWDYAQKMLDFGFYLSFGGIITYQSGERILETVKKAPLDRILIETDSPWLAPEPLRSSINEPKNIVLVAQKIAEVRGMSYDEVCKITYENGKRLFKIN